MDTIHKNVEIFTWIHKKIMEMVTWIHKNNMEMVISWWHTEEAKPKKYISDCLTVLRISSWLHTKLILHQGMFKDIIMYEMSNIS